MQDLNDFYFFAAVVNHGGFSAAARALRVPKSKLSKHVTGLEKRLGVRMIERSTRKFRVTELGLEFYRHCEAIVAGAEEAEAIVARAKSEPHGTLRVSCPTGFSNHIMAGVLPGFMRSYPKLRVEIMSTNRRVDLIEERIDAAFRVRTKLDNDSSLTVRILGNSRVLLVASPGFAATHAAKLNIDTLGELPTLSYFESAERETWLLAHADGRSAEVVHRPILGCSDFHVLVSAAAAGLGVSLVPDEYCGAAIRAGTLVHVLPEWTHSEGIVHLVFTSKRGLLPATRAFIDYVSREVPKAIAQCRAQ